MNPVEEYLRDRPNIIISSKKLKKILNLKNYKQSYRYCINSENIQRMPPISVGSNKNSLNIFRYKSN